MVSSGFTNLQDLITDNSGTQTDALGRAFRLGTILDPQTTCIAAAGGVDPVSGIQNPSNAPVYVRDPFYTGGSLVGVKSFTGMTNSLNVLPANRIDPNAVKITKALSGTESGRP